jgi:hypothetical protein
MTEGRNDPPCQFWEARVPRIQPTRRELLGGLAATGLAASLTAVRAADRPADAKLD